MGSLTLPLDMVAILAVVAGLLGALIGAVVAIRYADRYWLRQLEAVENRLAVRPAFNPHSDERSPR